MSDRRGTRVSRTAAVAAGADQDTVAERLSSTRILVELEDSNPNGIECLYSTVRQAVLMWNTVTVSLPGAAEDLAARCMAIAQELRPGQGAVRIDRDARHADFDGVVHIGPATFADPKVVSVTNTGWIVHVFAAPTGGTCATTVLPNGTNDNGLAAIGASALAVGEVFLRTIGVARPLVSFDLSLFDYGYGALRSLSAGPALPPRIDVAGLLVGAGTVGAGFAYAISPVRLLGWIALVDHDAARRQNFGPHMYVPYGAAGVAKVTLLEAALTADHPNLRVIAKPERLRLFRYRIGKDVPHPDVVISGLDKARPRQEVQRLWAPLHIDMATKDGLQIQVMVRSVPGTGLCLVRRFPIGTEENEEAEIARRTGLAVDAIADELAPITDADVASAPAEHSLELAAARARGERRCNLITRGDLGDGTDSDDYIGSAPFTALFAGIVAASELVKARGLGLDRDGTFVLWHFVSLNLYVERTRCAETCECATAEAIQLESCLPDAH